MGFSIGLFLIGICFFFIDIDIKSRFYYFMIGFLCMGLSTLFQSFINPIIFTQFIMVALSVCLFILSIICSLIPLGLRFLDNRLIKHGDEIIRLIDGSNILPEDAVALKELIKLKNFLDFFMYAVAHPSCSGLKDKIISILSEI